MPETSDSCPTLPPEQSAIEAKLAALDSCLVAIEDRIRTHAAFIGHDVMVARQALKDLLPSLR